MEKQLELLQINVNDHTEKKKTGSVELTYLSWAWAWIEFLKVYPDATYSVRHYDNKPFFFDENLGYMVFTEINAGGITKEMWLPVMDGANKPMKKEAYQYKTKYDTKTCEACDMFAINKTIMRCLTKNLAMFGLGTYIYAGEDLPEPQELPEATENVLNAIKNCLNIEEIQSVLKKYQSQYKLESMIPTATARKQELKDVNIKG